MEAQVKRLAAVKRRALRPCERGPTPPLCPRDCSGTALVRTTSTLGVSNPSKFEVLEEMRKMPIVLLAEPMFNHYNIWRG